MTWMEARIHVDVMLTSLHEMHDSSNQVPSRNQYYVLGYVLLLSQSRMNATLFTTPMSCKIRLGKYFLQYFQE